MKIYLATGNRHKKQELAEILSRHTIVIPSDEGIDFNPVEDGSDFYENSIIKAKSLYSLVHCPVIADDSGISVDALGGIPGIYSSRYCGPDFPRGRTDGTTISQYDKNKLLIEQLNSALEAGNLPPADFSNGSRSAHYTCAMVLYCGSDRIFIAQETMEGCLVERIEDAAGKGGFGYDPIFFLPQFKMTAAELTAKQKNAVSHRGKAARALLRLIE
ncbi:MAG: non-canonical purine NTP pyrophosphatase [Treponema sp.]